MHANTSFVSTNNGRPSTRQIIEKHLEKKGKKVLVLKLVCRLILNFEMVLLSWETHNTFPMLFPMEPPWAPDKNI